MTSYDLSSNFIEDLQSTSILDNKPQVSYEELTALSKMEGQVWIGLLQFLMSTHCQQNYKLNSNNQANILKYVFPVIIS